jgi:hypothetical protein
LNSRERTRSAATASARRNNRYTSDTNKRRLPLQDADEARLYGRELSSDGSSSNQTDLRTPQALAAAALLRGSLGNIAHVGATLPSGSQAQSFLWELVLSFFLMFVIMAVATDTRAVGEAAAIAIGGTIGLDAMFGGPISGASMNPMRSAGPALVAGDLHALWLYIVAPLAGAALGALAYQFVRGEPTHPAELPVVESEPGRTLEKERL